MKSGMGKSEALLSTVGCKLCVREVSSTDGKGEEADHLARWRNRAPNDILAEID
jgi:hypothetical protein